MRRFKEKTDYFGGEGSVYQISETQLVLHGGGSFYSFEGDDDRGLDPLDDPPDEVSDEVRGAAERLARKYNMEIVSIEGKWWGYSEYTPDPGDVTVVAWRPL